MPYLNWLTRDEDIGAARKASYGILEEVPEHSTGDPNTENMLIQGDNLDALKALLGHVVTHPWPASSTACRYSTSNWSVN